MKMGKCWSVLWTPRACKSCVLCVAGVRVDAETREINLHVAHLISTLLSFPPFFFRHSIPSRLFLSWIVSQEHVPAAGIKADAPVVGLVLQKSHINTKDECHYVALVAELEARGAKVRKE